MKSIYFVNATSLLAPEKHAGREEEGPRLLTLVPQAIDSCACFSKHMTTSYHLVGLSCSCLT